VSVSEALPINIATEDILIDIQLDYDLSQPAFPGVLPSTPLILTVEPGFRTDYVTWDLNRGVDSHFYCLEQFSNLNNVYLLLPIVSPTLPPLPRTTVDDNLLEDVSYSTLFFL